MDTLYLSDSTTSETIIDSISDLRHPTTLKWNRNGGKRLGKIKRLQESEITLSHLNGTHFGEFDAIGWVFIT